MFLNHSKYLFNLCNATEFANAPIGGPFGNDTNYFRDTMIKTLNNGAVCFTFNVQIQDDPCVHPIENAQVDWGTGRSNVIISLIFIILTYIREVLPSSTLEPSSFHNRTLPNMILFVKMDYGIRK
jgi:hypothetical protein